MVLAVDSDRSDIEANLTQLREQLVLHDGVEVIEAGRSPPIVTAPPIVVASAKHPHALAHTREGRFDRPASVECGAQFERRPMDIPIRIRPELCGEALDPQQDSVDLQQHHAHR